MYWLSELRSEENTKPICNNEIMAYQAFQVLPSLSAKVDTTWTNQFGQKCIIVVLDDRETSEPKLATNKRLGYLGNLRLCDLIADTQMCWANDNKVIIAIIYQYSLGKVVCFTSFT